MNEQYWRVFTDEIVEDLLGLSLTDYQRQRLLKALMLHREMEHESCGHVEADRSVVRLSKSDAQSEIVRRIEDLTRELGNASGKIADSLSHSQTLALARLFNFREYLTRELHYGV